MALNTPFICSTSCSGSPQHQGSFPQGSGGAAKSIGTFMQVSPCPVPLSPQQASQDLSEQPWKGQKVARSMQTKWSDPSSTHPDKEQMWGTHLKEVLLSHFQGGIEEVQHVARVLDTILGRLLWSGKAVVSRLTEVFVTAGTVFQPI